MQVKICTSEDEGTSRWMRRIFPPSTIGNAVQYIVICTTTSSPKLTGEEEIRRKHRVESVVHAEEINEGLMDRSHRSVPNSDYEESFYMPGGSNVVLLHQKPEKGPG